MLMYPFFLHAKSDMTLLGALGYIAPSVGWGSDSVVEFEVALADGRLVTASATSNSDLFRALKGGGSNFGIVTKLVMQTIPIGNIWISNSVYDSSAQESIIKAFHDFVADPGYDPKANLLMNYHYTAEGGLQFANQYTYAAPVVKPAAYNVFYPIQGQIGNESAVTNIADYSISQDSGSPDGFWYVVFEPFYANAMILTARPQANYLLHIIQEQHSATQRRMGCVQSEFDEGGAHCRNLMGTDIRAHHGLSRGGVESEGR